MAPARQDVDWHQFIDHQNEEPVTSTRHRLRWILALFALALAIILVRAAQLEFSDGEQVRRLASQPLERLVSLSPTRGTIFARDGSVLAADRVSKALALHYRYLENPPNPDWLRRMARARLPSAERRRPERLAAMEATLREELGDLHRRLARMSGLFDEQWQARTRLIQRQVDDLATHVNQRRLARHHEQLANEPAERPWSLGYALAGLFAPPEPLPPPPILLAEQAAYHRIVNDIRPEVAAEIEKNFADYPGAKIVEYSRRDYPMESAAAHWIGYLGSRSGAKGTAVTAATTPADEAPTGLLGIERRWDLDLRGQPGLELHTTDHRGNLLSTTRKRDPTDGRNLVLTLDVKLQIAAEQLLDRFARRLERQDGSPNTAEHGGAIVVMDVHSGEILAAASAPRFDPNAFAAGDPRIERVLRDPGRPLFDRVTKMAIPPGSIFKPLTALALLESGSFDPREPFCCQGYLRDPDQLRCLLFRQHGIGHGEVTLSDALTQSCNVYFFHHANELGAAALLDWSARLGLGKPTGIDLPDEAAGQLPTLEQLGQDSQLQAFSIGQGSLTVTPLQMARLYAAIANGGYLLEPRATRERFEQAEPRRESSMSRLSRTERIAALDPKSLETLREGLRRVVEDPRGTAHATVRSSSLSIAGKTGTAQTSSGQEDHAWFAGYVPAESPKFAFVVVFEHAGSGATIAGAAAKSLVQAMQQLGYFGQPKMAETPIPPGKG